MNKSVKTKLIATIISIVCAMSLVAVGVMASLTNFQVAVGNQLNLEFNAVEGQLYATRVGDVAGTDRTTSKVLSESATATDWLNVYNGASVEPTNLDSIQEKVNFVSNDKIKDIVNGGRTYVAVTYYFYYVLPEGAASNNVTLTAPAVTDENVIVTYSYTKASSATLPAFTNVPLLTNGGSVTVEGGEGVFIKAEARVNLTKSVNIENVDWNFTLNFGMTSQPVKADNGVWTTAEPINGNYFYYIELGEYPQTLVEDTAMVSALNALGDSAKTGRTFTIGASEDTAQTAHIEYLYDGAKYVKVESALVYNYESKFTSGTDPVAGESYWFKVEPIKWFLLEAYSTTKTAYNGSTTNLRVVSEKLLTAGVKFDETSNEWSSSNIRDWLNNTFYNDAFSNSDQAHIIKNTTRYFGTGEYETQDDYTVTTGGSTSEDNVWLLSYYEVYNTYYDANMYLYQRGRSAAVTDFTVVTNVWMRSNGCADYWLRSPFTFSFESCHVVCFGGVGGNTVYDGIRENPSRHAVRPALTISL